MKHALAFPRIDDDDDNDDDRCGRFAIL